MDVVRFFKGDYVIIESQDTGLYNNCDNFSDLNFNFGSIRVGNTGALRFCSSLLSGDTMLKHTFTATSCHQTGLTVHIGLLQTGRFGRQGPFYTHFRTGPSSGPK